MLRTKGRCGGARGQGDGEGVRRVTGSIGCPFSRMGVISMKYDGGWLGTGLAF